MGANCTNAPVAELANILVCNVLIAKYFSQIGAMIQHIFVQGLPKDGAGSKVLKAGDRDVSLVYWLEEDSKNL